MRLADLWYISLALALFSLLIMAGLIITRFFVERHKRKVTLERSRIMPLLLDHSSDPSALSERALSKGLLADLTVELVQLVRGEDRDRFVDAATCGGVTATLVRRLTRGSARARATAAEALAHFRGSDSTAALHAALSDRNCEVRMAAALALAETGREPPIEVLIERLGLGSMQISLLVTNLFQKIADRDPAQIEALITDNDVTINVKSAAVDALTSIRGFALAPVVNALVMELDPDSPELPKLIRALGLFQHPAGIPGVSFHLDSRFGWVRAAAAEAAGRIGMMESSSKLAAMLGDIDWWVRFRSGEALARLGQSGIARLREASRRGIEPARSAARLTLAELGIER